MDKRMSQGTLIFAHLGYAGTFFLAEESTPFIRPLSDVPLGYGDDGQDKN